MDPVINSPRDPVYAIGFQKAFIQDVNQSATRLSFSWAGEVDLSPANACGRIILRDYPITCDHGNIHVTVTWACLLGDSRSQHFLYSY